MTRDRNEIFKPDWIEAYLLGELPDEQVRALDAQLRDDPEALKRFAAAVEIMSLVREEFRGRQEQGSLRSDEPVLRDFDLLFSELLQAEREAKTVTVHLQVEEPPVVKPDLPSLHEVRRVSGYLFTRPLVWGPLAAILVLSTVVFWPTPHTPAPPRVGQTAPPTQYDPAPAPTVATLTGEHNARWAHDAPQVGRALRPGERLVLTDGFAQITTARGAVAILEAPCTVIMIDSPNALRLHTGKLVGICETDASKGFVVRTAHMDVTDLGTRFGVDAGTEASTVHVFEGMVHARHPQAPIDVAPMPVVVNQSARASVNHATVKRVDPDAERFITLQPLPIRLPGTGQGLATIQLDSNWLVMTAGGVPLDPPAAMFVAHHTSYGAFRDQSGDASAPWWLQYHPALEPTAQQPSVVHLIQSEFELGPDLDPETTRLVIACGADNVLKAIHVNGNRITELGKALDRVHHITIDQHLRPGRNTVVFEVENLWQDPKRNPIGLYVQWHLLPAAAPSDGLRGGIGLRD